MSARASHLDKKSPKRRRAHASSVFSATDAQDASKRQGKHPPHLLARLDARLRRGERWLATRLTRAEWGFVWLLVFCYGFFLTPAGTNTISRYDMVYALLHGTAIIDKHAYNTIDISAYHGHFYSPRSLGLSLLAVPVLFVLAHIINIDHYQSFRGLTEQIAALSAFTVLPVCVIGAVALKRFAERLRPQLAGTPLPIVVAGAFALGTIAFSFATTFFSEAFGGALAFIGFYLLYRARSQPHPWLRVLISGLLVGFAVISEYPVGLIMLILFGYVLVSFPHRRLKTLLTFVGGIAPNALLLGWYDWFAFGNPFNLSYAFVADREFAGQHEGFFGITLPHPDGFWAIMVYPRGILLESPFLLLVPLGLFFWLRSAWLARRTEAATTTWLNPLVKWIETTPEAWVSLALCALYPLVISAYFIPMAGENLPGPRLLVPVLPFACLALAWVVDDARRLIRWFFALSLCYGVALEFIFVAAGVRVLSAYKAFPITELYWPILSTGYVPAKNGMTPPNLGVMLFALPQGLSLYVFLIPLAIWTFFAVRAIIRATPHSKPDTVSAPEPDARRIPTEAPDSRADTSSSGALVGTH